MPGDGVEYHFYTEGGTGRIACVKIGQFSMMPAYMAIDQPYRCEPVQPDGIIEARWQGAMARKAQSVDDDAVFIQQLRDASERVG